MATDGVSVTRRLHCGKGRRAGALDEPQDRHWEHDAEYSMWHSTHQHVIGMDNSHLSSTAPGAEPLWSDADAPAARGHASLSAESEAESGGDGLENLGRHLDVALPGLGAGGGGCQVLRLRAKLLARNVDVATALSVGEALHSRLGCFVCVCV